MVIMLIVLDNIIVSDNIFNVAQTFNNKYVCNPLVTIQHNNVLAVTKFLSTNHKNIVVNHKIPVHHP